MPTIIIKESNSNKPVPQALVELISTERTYAGYTRNDGCAIFPTNNFRDGHYIIKLRHPNHRPYTRKHYINKYSIIKLETVSSIIF